MIFGEKLYPLVMSKKILKMAIEIVDLPIKHGDIFHSYVSLPEGNILLEMCFLFH